MNGLPSFGDALTADQTRRLAGHPEQLGGAELLSRGDGSERGVRVVRLRNAEIEVEVVIDRALDLAGAWIRGVPVAWRSPTGIAGPWYGEPAGLGTFRTFFGGLLTTCGLEHTLGATTDETPYFDYPGRPRDAFPLHGRVSAIPARLQGYGVAEDGTLFVQGEVRQASVFGEVLLLRRRIEIAPAGRAVSLTDEVINDGYAPTPHLVLYHVNTGWPVVAPGAEIAIGSARPRIATEAARNVDWRTIEDPRAGAVEQVWEHVPATAPDDGWVHAAVLNPDVGGGRPVGVELAYDPSTLPRLFEWRVMAEGHYVIGLEPGNVRIEGRRAAGAAGELVVVAPGASVTHRLRLRLLWGRAELADARARCAAVGGEG